MKQNEVRASCQIAAHPSQSCMKSVAPKNSFQSANKGGLPASPAHITVAISWRAKVVAHWAAVTVQERWRVAVRRRLPIAVDRSWPIAVHTSWWPVAISRKWHIAVWSLPIAIGWTRYVVAVGRLGNVIIHATIAAAAPTAS